MELQEALRVRATWASRVGIFSKLLKRGGWGLLAAAGLAFGAIAPAQAACTSPQTASIPSGGSATFTCADFGFESPAVSGPSHGTLTWGTPGNVNALVYTNNGDGALSDTFVVEDDFSVPITFNITIGPATSPIVVSPANLPAPTVGVAYSQTLSSTGGVAPYSYALTGGSLPPGLTMSGSTISGTSTGSGPYNFTVTVTDSTAPTALTAVKSYGFTIAAPILDLVQDTPPAATVGIPYSLQFTTMGGTAPYTYSIEPGPGLPPGLSMSSSGLVSGTPTTLGSYTFALRYDDDTSISTGGDHFVVQNVTIVVAAAPTIVVNPATVPGATVGVAYSQTFTGSGGTAPYTFAISAGALPAGLTLNTTTGALTGTPTAGGTFNFTVRATDANTFSGTRAYSMTVAAPTITVAPTTLPNGGVGTAYSQTLTASGGTATYSFAITAGALPAGLSLSSTGTLSGTPTAGGTFNFTATATDSTTGTGPFTGSRAYALVVAAPTVTLPPTTLANGTVGLAYSAALNPASGGTAPYAYAITAGALPPGVSMSSAGNLSGTPTAAGNFNFAVTATDSSTGSGPYSSAPRGYSLQIVQIPPVANPVSATVAYNSGANPITLNVTGGIPTSVAIGSAPAHGTAIASGTSITYQPTAGYAGADSFTYTATNSAGASAPATVTITVANPVITVTASGVFSAQVGVPYSQTFTWAGGTAPYSGFNVAGLPAGLSITANTADSVTVSGTPTATGSFSLNASATDSSTGNGPFTHGQIFVLTVAAPTLAMTPAPGTLNLPYGSPYSQTFVASGGVGPYSYSLVAGALPVGVSLSSAGVLSGTPTVPGSYALTIRATDSSTGAGAPFSIDQNYVLQVGAPTIVIAPPSLPDGTAGTPYSQTFSASGGVGPYTFSLIAGALPVGMSMSSAGVFSGTPTVAGTYNFTVRATDSNGQTADQAYALTIAAPTISVDPPTLPGGTAGTPYSQTFSANGGAGPYTFSLTAGGLPIGMFMSSSGVFSGTPTVAGTYNFTVRATDSNGFTGDRAYSLVVAAPVIVIDPSALPGGTAGTPYSATLTASGGTAPYSFSIVSGTLPVGVSFSSAGTYSGTPTTDGTYNATIRATDANGFTADQPYSIVIAAPTIVISPAALPGGAVGVPYSQSLSSSGGAAPYSYSIVSGNLPTGVSFSSAGVYSGTPTTAGSYTANIRSTDSNGFNATVAYTIVIADAVPVAVPDSATTLAGAAVTIPVTANDTGIITSVAVASAPAHGTAAVSGLGVLYTPAAGYSGTDTFTYTAIGPGGTSAPATVTVTVNPVPVAVSSHVETTSDTTVHVDLTAGASGGPFTAATLVSLSPASSGTATITGSGGAYELTFVPAAGFSGLATVTFTLSNAFAVSAPATVEILVAGRSDPSKDPEVLGLLEAQASAARRFAASQIGNFQQRMENMHGGAEGRGGFQNNISFAGQQRCSSNARRAYEDPECAQTMLRDEDAPVAAPAPMQSGESARNPLGFWAGGSISRGDRDPRTGVSGFDFETSGVSAGGDVRLSPSFALGGGIGYGRDDTDVGGSGTRTESDAYTVAMYASYHPGERFYLDGLLGYQWLSFDNRRFVTDTGGLVRGERDGKQWLASLAAGMDYRSDRVTFSPYARLDVARARLDAYTEQGDPTHALAFHRQNVDTATGNLGFRLDYRNDLSWGTFSPQLRLELQHDFEDDGSATMGYADFPAGPLYRALVQNLDRNRTIFGLGFALQTERDLRLRVEFRTLFDGDGESDNGVLLNLEKKY